MSKKFSLDEMKSLLESIRSGSDDQESAEAGTTLGKAEEVISAYSKFRSNDDNKVFGELISTLATNPNRHRFAARVDPGIFKQFGEELISTGSDQLIPAYLDIFRSPVFLTKVYDNNEWPELILKLLHEGNYTFPKMFFHRSSKYRNKTLFTVLESDKSVDFSWSKISKLMTSYSRGLLALLGGTSSDSKVAFLTKNSLDMVLFDLACLTSGIVNVMIPANSVLAHIEYILNKTKPAVLIISDQHLY